LKQTNNCMNCKHHLEIEDNLQFKIWKWFISHTYTGNGTDSSKYTTEEWFFDVIIYNLRTAAFKVYCGIWVRRSNFRHQASPRESTQRRKVELWTRNVREFCLNFDFHVIFRNLLHAVKRRHGTDGFTSPPKEGVLRIFRPKNSTASAGCEHANLGTKGQHAISRPPKPLFFYVTLVPELEILTWSWIHEAESFCRS